MGAEARAIAARAIAGVLRGASLSERLPALEERVAPRDRALLRELCHGSCRYAVRLEYWLGQLLARPLKTREYEVRALLLSGLYQLEYLRVPPHAAISESVEAARLLGKPWAVGLVNAVLRNFQRRRDALLVSAGRIDAVRHACPGWLLGRLRRAWPEQADKVLDAWLQRPAMTLRVNRRRSDIESARARLAAAGIEARPVAGAPDALRLERAAPVERLPGFAEGELSVQDTGAQFAAALLAPRDGQRVLDVCAAPGGKSGHLLERADIELTALDVDAARLARVAENLDRLGLTARLELADASLAEGAWYRCDYDRILVDAPCSATGVIQRHADIKLLRRDSDIEKLAEQQARILRNVWPRLRAGGMLLYVSCSVLPEENAEQMTRFLAEHPDAEVVPIALDGAFAAGVGSQLLPGCGPWDGFFHTLLRRRPA